MGVNSLPKTVIRQRRDCDLNPGPSAPESSTLTTRLPSHAYVFSRADKRTDSPGQPACRFLRLPDGPTAPMIPRKPFAPVPPSKPGTPEQYTHN